MKSRKLPALLLGLVSVMVLSPLFADTAFPQNKMPAVGGPVLNAQSTPSTGVYEAVLSGKSCKDNPANQSLDCEYKVGSGLHFLIEFLGQPDTGITFLKSSADEDFYASFGVLHGCVIVGKGAKSGAIPNVPEFAFVSPKNGKVYKTWEECKEGW